MSRNKNNLIAAAACGVNVTQEQAAAVINGFLREIIEETAMSGRLCLQEFGAFRVAIAKPRMIPLPGGKKKLTKPSIHVAFRASPHFREACRKAEVWRKR